ncbi:MAG: valine--tRNA ligase, partial [Myxococcales bacterium]|nr:valine--tRNA ligase [Myxococcales bacterium]
MTEPNANDFPKNYDPKTAEAQWRAYWEEHGIHRWDPSATAETFSVDTPPPYVSADHLHVGHAMSYSQADFVVRYNRMRGRNVFYPMGFDDNGLPTERFVEKKHKVDKRKISRKDFIALCLEETRKGAKTYEELWRTLGVSVDWSLTYSTIDPRCRRTAQTSFIDLWEKGLIERREDPIQWCHTCQTSLAQADVETEDQDSALHEIQFKAADGTPLVIATTRPELIGACVALYTHPEDERYKHLHGTNAVVPLYDLEVPIKTDESVDRAYGTGLMMVCTWGDVEDVRKWKEHRLGTRLIFTHYGKLNELGGKYAGLSAKDARKAVVEDLKAAGLHLGSKTLTHAVGVHDRCSTPVEFHHAPQWFIRVLDFKKELLARGEELAWRPEMMKVRYRDWVDGLKWDWCISRQRFYGVPFPVWYCEDCEAPKIAGRDELPVDPTEDRPRDPKCAKCGSERLRPEEDVMDTWMTSSLTPQINGNWALPGEERPGLFPMSMRPQAFEIIRTWLFYTVAKAHFHADSLPWNTVMISGWGLDKQGKKMSKRLGNFVDPYKVVQQYSSDALRYWTATPNLGHNLRYDERDVANGKKIVTKLWNSTKFLAMNLGDHAPGKLGDAYRPTMIDRWCLSKLHGAIDTATRAFDVYEYAHALRATEGFFWTVLCDNYMEIIKDRFWLPDEYGQDAVTAARETLYQASHAVLRMFAPFMPFITE